MHAKSETVTSDIWTMKIIWNPFTTAATKEPRTRSDGDASNWAKLRTQFKCSQKFYTLLAASYCTNVQKQLA